VPVPRPGWRSRALGVLARRFGAQSIIPTLVGMERVGGQGYAVQPEARGSALPGEERSHARVLRELAGPAGGIEGAALAQMEGRHRATSGNALRAAVLGANDGLLSNFSLVMGVAGDQLAGRAVLITGDAGLLAGAGSIALSEWISVQSSRELYYLALREYVDAIITLVAIAPIVAVGVALEARAEHALEQLRRLATPRAIVWRDGAQQAVPTDALVPGDLALLHEGDIIPADGALLAGAQLSADESALTGESVPATKDAADASEDRAVYAGTTVLAGRGFARLTATGPRTRYGRIGALVAEVKPPPTPLKRLIRRLVRQLGLAALVVCLLVVLLELARGRGWATTPIAGVSLAIAAVPEEFPLVYTLYLTLGAWRLAHDRALVRRLAAVETLGGTTVICADKTGTLTLGQLAVGALATASGPVRVGDELDPAARALPEAAVRASEPQPFDPLEQAILRFATEYGVDVAALHGGTLVRDYPFDPAGKYMSHVWRCGDTLEIHTKGSTEGILARATADDALRRRLLAATHQLATEGMRVIAVAAGPLPGMSAGRAVAERFLRSVRRECRDHLLLLGEAHLRRACGEYVASCNPVRDPLSLVDRKRYVALVTRLRWGLGDEYPIRCR
jgi:magnesium-transporting ATPase (P-type)